MLAIWDSHNRTDTINTDGMAGIPIGWRIGYYWSATPTAPGHALVALNLGYIYDNVDNGIFYVALQVF